MFYQVQNLSSPLVVSPLVSPNLAYSYIPKVGSITINVETVIKWGIPCSPKDIFGGVLIMHFLFTFLQIFADLLPYFLRNFLLASKHGVETCSRCKSTSILIRGIYVNNFHFLYNELWNSEIDARLSLWFVCECVCALKRGERERERVKKRERRRERKR